MALDPRLKQQLSPWRGERADAVLIGVPFDHGVELNNGRWGAAEGPQALRHALRSFGTTYDVENDVDFSELSLGDAGNVAVVPENVEGTHEAVTSAVRRILDAGALPIVVGGGNDATFASVRALVEHVSATNAGPTKAIGGINVDAHFDVREVTGGRVTSGTPFRLILDDLGVSGGHFVELGAHAHVNSKAHRDYLLERGATIVPLGKLRTEGVQAVTERELERLELNTDASFVSMDMDVFGAPFAPGVSAPGTQGLHPEEGRSIAFAAGANANVRLFELMELNPRFDIDERTARLSAMLLCAFLAGLATRTRGLSTQTPAPSQGPKPTA